MMYPSMFKSRYKLVGRDWIRRISPEDQRVFIELGLSAMAHGHMGGIARAQSATRDVKGRFARTQ